MDHTRKFLFAGPPGVGKSTAIAAISDTEPVTTEMAATDELTDRKNTTTAALDFGEMRLDDGEVIRLYGTPGQQRFDFMWPLLRPGAMGVVVLLDKTRPDPIADLDIYLDSFQSLIEDSGAVVGVTRYEIESGPDIDAIYHHLGTRGVMIPVIECDIREREDVALIMEALISTIEHAA